MKFYDEVMKALRGFFGKDEATEAELHQSLLDAENMEAIQTKASAAASESVRAEMDAMKSEFAGLKDQLAALTAANEEKATLIANLQESVKTLTESGTEKDATIAQQAEQIKTLSGELATYKVGKPAAQAAEPVDGSIPVPSNPQGGTNARVVSGATLAKIFEN